MTQQQNRRISKKCNYVLLPLGGLTGLILGLIAYLYFPHPLPRKPTKFTLIAAREAGLKFYVVDVDTKEEFEQVKDLPIDGIITNRIEVIGPLLKR